jgi:hypothetical protein
VVGAEAVRASFEAVFNNGGASRPSRSVCGACHPAARCTAWSSASICTAKARTGWVATNVYVKTGLGWRMVAHHASPGLAGEVPGDRRDRLGAALKRCSTMDAYRAPGWSLGRVAARRQRCRRSGPALWSRRWREAAPRYTRERWTTPDGDFIDVDHQRSDQAAAPGQKRPCWCCSTAWRVRRPATTRRPSPTRRARGAGTTRCRTSAAARASSTSRRAPTTRVTTRRSAGSSAACAPAHPAAAGPLLAVGVSLGGNALLRWAEEAGDSALATASAVAAVSSPIDLAAGGQAIGRGFNRQVYTRMFLRSMRPKALAKLVQHPRLFSRERLLAARDLYDFDNVFTAPLHGFRDTDDYWLRGLGQAPPGTASVCPRWCSMR